MKSPSGSLDMEALFVQTAASMTSDRGTITLQGLSPSSPQVPPVTVAPGVSPDPDTEGAGRNRERPGPVAGPPNRPLVHRAAAGDQVDQYADQGEEQHEKRNHRALAPPDRSWQRGSSSHMVMVLYRRGTANLVHAGRRGDLPGHRPAPGGPAAKASRQDGAEGGATGTCSRGPGRMSRPGSRRPGARHPAAAMAHKTITSTGVAASTATARAGGKYGCDAASQASCWPRRPQYMSLVRHDR